MLAAYASTLLSEGRFEENRSGGILLNFRPVVAKADQQPIPTETQRPVVIYDWGPQPREAAAESGEFCPVVISCITVAPIQCRSATGNVLNEIVWNTTSRPTNRFPILAR